MQLNLIALGSIVTLQYWFFQSKSLVYLSICLSLISFISILQFSESRSFVPYVGLYLGNFFFLSDVNGKWYCFLNFSLWSFIISVWNVRDFCVFCILQFEPKSLTVSSSFLVASSGFSVCSILSTVVTVLLVFQFGFLFFLFLLCCG